jgi:hypothetical protein
LIVECQTKKITTYVGRLSRFRIQQGRSVYEERYLIRRFLRGSVREEFVYQLQRMKDLDTVFLVQIPPDRDPASRASCNHNGSPCLPDVL